jgi:hypothetical protein
MKTKLLISLIAILSVTASAVASWPKVYNSTLPNTNGAKMVIDGEGNVIASNYVTSADFQKTGTEITKFNRFGALQWSHRFYDFKFPLLVSIDVDAAGSVYLLGTNRDNFLLTMMLDANGLKKWSKVAFADGRGYSTSDKVVALPEGGCVVTGSSLSKGNSYDVLTVRYSNTGAVQWSRQLDVSGEAEHPNDMVINGAGEIFVTGSTSGTDNGDLLLIKYRSDGALLWVRTFDGANGGLDYDEGRNLTFDSIGGVIVAGTISSTDGTHDAIVARYNSDGTRLWYKRIYLLRNRTDDSAWFVKLCPDNNIVALIYMGAESATVDSYLVRKFDMGGETVWSRSITRTDSGGDSILGAAVGMEVTANNELFISSLTKEDGEYTMLTTKIDGASNPLWEQLYRPGPWAVPKGTAYDRIHKKFFVIGGGPNTVGVASAIIARY